MSAEESRRVAVMARVVAGELRVGDAAVMLGVTYRQTKRVVARYRAGGAAALVHGNVGRASHRARPAAERTRVVALVRTEYGGCAERGPGQRFGPTLAAEHLWDEQGALVPVTTLRRWMTEAGLWSRVRQGRKRCQRRERRAHVGELVQLDGSFHDWLEGRGPEGAVTRCLMTMIDDATGRTLGHFTGEETIWGAAGLLRAWIAQYGGVPQALYVDAKNLYVSQGTTAERVRGVRAVTHFGRMCRKLGIRVIVAGSPQAKGRVERVHGTNQDRLIKKMRRAGVTTYAAANAYLATTYWPGHNARFGVAPASPVDYHVPRVQVLADADVWCIETERVVGNDWVVRYENRGYQLTAKGRGGRWCTPGRRVVVRETEDGAVRIVVVTPADTREHAVAWTPVAVPVRGVSVAGRPRHMGPRPPAPRQRPRRGPSASSGAVRGPTAGQLANRARWQAHFLSSAKGARGLKAYNARRQAEIAARRGSASAPPAPPPPQSTT